MTDRAAAVRGALGWRSLMTTVVRLAWTFGVLVAHLLPRSDTRALLGFRTSFEATEIPA